MATTICALYYPDQAGATDSVVWQDNDRRPKVPADPIMDDNAEYALNAGGNLLSRSAGEERRRFTLVLNNIDATTISDLETFFKNVKGALETFEYLHTDSVLYTCRWINNFKYLRKKNSFHDITLELEEEIS